MIGARAEPIEYGALEAVALELYLMERARGIAIETPAARALVAASVSNGRLRSRERSVIPCCGIYSPTVVIWGLSPKSGKATLARIPLLADLILDRQAGRCGGAVLSVCLVRCLRLVDVPDEVVDGGFLAHVSSLRASACFCHSDPPVACAAAMCEHKPLRKAVVRCAVRRLYESRHH
jgi:hypothetical protein